MVKITVNKSEYTLPHQMVEKAFTDSKDMTSDELEDTLLLETDVKICNNIAVGLIRKSQHKQ